MMNSATELLWAKVDSLIKGSGGSLEGSRAVI